MARDVFEQEMGLQFVQEVSKCKVRIIPADMPELFQDTDTMGYCRVMVAGALSNFTLTTYIPPHIVAAQAQNNTQERATSSQSDLQNAHTL